VKLGLTHIRTLTLKRPEKRNALSNDFHKREPEFTGR